MAQRQRIAGYKQFSGVENGSVGVVISRE